MQKINFENLPSTNTPINATNLNQLQTNVENAIAGVVESGSNGNGSWVKFEDGTMIQYGRYDTLSNDFSTAYGSIYYDGTSHTIIFPQEFLTNSFPKVTATLNLNGGIGGINLTSLPSASQFSAYIYSTRNYFFNNTAEIYWQAIGRWK